MYTTPATVFEIDIRHCSQAANEDHRWALGKCVTVLGIMEVRLV